LSSKLQAEILKAMWPELLRDLIKALNGKDSCFLANQFNSRIDGEL
jgi:hypothetical protein